MRILNRALAAGVLALPIALVASGVAVADVAAGSSVLPTQIGESEDGSSDKCDDEKGGILGILGGEDKGHLDEGECEEDGNSPLG
ncbi:MAG: hypothetical protein ACRDS9_12725 [Pseudonocardiaceae bacterium]